MTAEIISWSISTKVWDRAGIELATPGSAVRHASVARHVTDCATRPGTLLVITCCGSYVKSHYLNVLAQQSDGATDQGVRLVPQGFVLMICNQIRLCGTSDPKSLSIIRKYNQVNYKSIAYPDNVS